MVPKYDLDAHGVEDDFSKEYEPWELEDMRRLRQGLENLPFGGSVYGVQPTKGNIMENLSVLDTMRLRYMKGEPLLQAGDSFDFTEGLEAMRIVNEEARARGLDSPVAVRQPN